MSFVDVSPSTETMLKVLAISVESAFWSMAGEIAQSVADEDEHGRHVGVDHAGAFADAADLAFLFLLAGEADGDLFAFCIGGHDALGSLVGVRAEAFDQLRNSCCDGRNVERLADHTGRSYYNVGRLDVQGLSRKTAHLLCNFDAVGVAGVGVAAVADDGLRLAVGQMLLRHDERRRIERNRCAQTAAALAGTLA